MLISPWFWSSRKVVRWSDPPRERTDRSGAFRAKQVLSTGVTYLPIPIGGAILFLFVVEHLTLGPPPDVGDQAHAPPAAFE